MQVSRDNKGNIAFKQKLYAADMKAINENLKGC
jgi:hypothetical protein